MIFRIRPGAAAQLDHIWDFIAQDNPQAADAFLDTLYSAIQRLAESPGIGHRRPDLAENAENSLQTTKRHHFSL